MADWDTGMAFQSLNALPPTPDESEALLSNH